jgi:hypothetical protein
MTAHYRQPIDHPDTTPSETHTQGGTLVRTVTSLRRLSCAALTLGLLLQGCDSNPIGGECTGDASCAFGLQCFQPDDVTQSAVCTIGCLDEPCVSGTCVQTQLYGAVCAGACSTSKLCVGTMDCQAATTPTGEVEVCWFDDPNFGTAAGPLTATEIVLVDDNNGDGQLNPGESGRLQFFVSNDTDTSYEGLWMQLASDDLDFVVTSCQQGAYPVWLNCTADCSCDTVPASKRVALSPGDKTALPLLDIAFQLDAAAVDTTTMTFDVIITDATGSTWPQTVSLPIVAHEAQVQITSATVVNDTNGDGRLSPGETGSIDLTVANLGTTHIEGLFAELSVADPAVTVDACHASVGSSWFECDVKCSCTDVTTQAKQSLQPSETGTAPILRLTVTVASDAVLEPIAFGVRFQDNLQAIWYDSFIIPLGEAEAELGLSRVEVLEDENGDGFVNPSETASVQVFAKNIGTGVARDIWAQLETPDPWTTVTSCRVGVGSHWIECDTDCSCATAPSSAFQDLEAGEHGTVAVLVITFEVNPSAPLTPLNFSVSFHDNLGNSWPDSFSLSVKPADAEVTIGNAALLDDSNGDGFLSPAESATLEIYPRNEGTSKALKVWAALSYAESLVELTSCYTTSTDSFGLCSSTCNCQDTGVTQDVEPDISSSQPILQINFTLSSQAPLQPISFEVTFHDELGSTWTDTVTVEVVKVKALIQVESASLWGDSNGDGILTPGESAKIQIKGRNVGISKTYGVYASLVNVDPYVDVTTCYAQFGDSWTKCDTECNCQNISENAKAELDSGETSEEVLLRINFTLSIDAPIEPLTWDIAFHDQFGNSWDDNFVIDVEKYAADIVVGFVEFQNDTNGDGYLSPAESASLSIYPRNDGTVTALGVWAKLVAVEPGVTITGCYTESDGAWINCGVGCNCDGVFESALQDLEGEQTSERPMLRIDFETASTVALGSLSFGVAFTDSLGLTWTDLILLDVVAPDTHVQIGIAEMISDSSGDGALNAGDTATVNVFAENAGTTTALGVWARLTNAAPGLEITSCYALNEEKWATCDVTCSCQSIPESIKTDILEGETSDAVVLQITFNVPLTTPPGPQSFTIELTDIFDNVWEDSFSIQLVE